MIKGRWSISHDVFSLENGWCLSSHSLAFPLSLLPRWFIQDHSVYWDVWHFRSQQNNQLCDYKWDITSLPHLQIGRKRICMSYSKTFIKFVWTELSSSASRAWLSPISSQLQPKVNTSSHFLFLQFYHLSLQCLPNDLCDKVMINITVIDTAGTERQKPKKHLFGLTRPVQLTAVRELWLPSVKSGAAGSFDQWNIWFKRSSSPIVHRFTWETLISSAEIIGRQWGS